MSDDRQLVKRLTAALSPVYAAYLANALGPGVLVLNGVPCPSVICTDGKIPSTPRIDCRTCGGAGTVAPPVEPGQRLNIAAVGDLPTSDEMFRLLGDLDRWNAWHAAGLAPDGDVGARLRTRKVVGSAVAASTALPIVDATTCDGLRTPHLCLHPWGQLHHVIEDEITDLSAALPWLPSDLVGRFGVLVEDAATTEQRCPRCNGGRVLWDDMGATCPVCKFTGTCPPVPLPDGFDPEPYTLTDLEMTDG